jgi:hypothetical protein
MITCDICKTEENVLDFQLPVGLVNIDIERKTTEIKSFKFQICFDCYISECIKGGLRDRYEENQKYADYILKLRNKEDTNV